MRTQPIRCRLSALTLATALFALPNSACPQTAAVDVARPAQPSAPLSPLVFESVANGPATPAAHKLRITNPGASKSGWKASASAPWLKLTPAEGELEAGASVELEVALVDAQLAALQPGCSIASLEWRVGGQIGADAPPSSVPVVLTRGQDGWTHLAPSKDSHVVFVSSSSGDDFFDGRSERLPKRTLAAAIAELRHGYPDWLLLKRGDTWNESLGHWKRSGRSAQEPLVVASYGDNGARPLLRSVEPNGLITLTAGDSPARIDHLALVGLHFAPNSSEREARASAVTLLAPMRDVLIEDCEFEGYEVNVTVAATPGRKQNIRLRRNLIRNAYATDGPVGHGIYLEAADQVLIEENLLERNGWNPAVEGATPSVFRHGIYVQSGPDGCTGVLLRGNIIASSSSHGVQLRPGGAALDNLLVDNPIGLLLGGGAEPTEGGVVAVARRNVVLAGRDLDAENPRGWGLAAENLRSGELRSNLIAWGRTEALAFALLLEGNTPGVGLRHVLAVDNVIHDWRGPLRIGGTREQLGPLSLERNRITSSYASPALVLVADAGALANVRWSENSYAGAAAGDAWFTLGEARLEAQAWSVASGDVVGVPPAAPEGGRPTLESYMASLGEPATLEAFLAGARAQSKSNWQPRYTAAAVNAYLRAGFAMR